jgi:hypothetical protein
MRVSSWFPPQLLSGIAPPPTGLRAPLESITTNKGAKLLLRSRPVQSNLDMSSPLRPSSQATIPFDYDEEDQPHDADHIFEKAGYSDLWPSYLSPQSTTLLLTGLLQKPSTS